MVLFSPFSPNLKIAQLQGNGTAFVTLDYLTWFFLAILGKGIMIWKRIGRQLFNPSSHYTTQQSYMRFNNDSAGVTIDSLASVIRLPLSRPFGAYSYDGYFDMSLPAEQFRGLSTRRTHARARARLLDNLAIPSSAWYVCLHVRESGFLGDTFREWMNQRIEDYWQLIDTVLTSGGYVVRMGDRTMTSLPQQDGVVDYAHSAFRSPLGDLLLIENCRFFVGSQSGLRVLAQIFRKPILTVNAYPLSPLDFYREHLILYKKVYAVQRNVCLDASDILFHSSLCHYDTDEEYDAAGLRIVDNTSEEMRQACEEMLSLVASDFSRGYTARQSAFESLVKASLVRSNHLRENGATMFYPAGFCRAAEAYLAASFKV